MPDSSRMWGTECTNRPGHGPDAGRTPLHDLRRRISLAVVLSFGVVLWHHVVNALVLGEENSLLGHAQYVLLGAMIGLPFAVAAIWVAERFVTLRVTDTSSWRDHAGFAAVVSLVFAVLLVPLSNLQSGIQQLLVGESAEHSHAAPTGLRLADLAEYGVQYSVIAQPVVFLLTMLTAGFFVSRQVTVGKEQRRRARVMFVAASTAVVTSFPLTDASALETTPEESGTDTRVAAEGSCDTAPQRVYDVTAINIDIVVDRWGDHDPFGFMYALNSQLDEIRAFEQATNDLSTMVSSGLQNDPIQPLVIRASLGDCVVVNLTNGLEAPPRGGPGPGGAGALEVDGDTNPREDLPEAGDGFVQQPGGVPSVSIDVQGVAFQADEGGHAVGNNPNSMVSPGQSRQYRFYLDPLMGEGGKVFHSGGDSEQLTAHGLFGAVIAEPVGSRWFDPRTGQERTNDRNWSSWDAMIQPFGSPAFREFAIMYHEFGDENFNMRMSRRAEDSQFIPGGAGVQAGPGPDGLGWPITMVDSAGPDRNPDVSGTLSYRPAGKAINYRSEPFWRRLRDLDKVFPRGEPGVPGDPLNAELAKQMKDKKALGYSSYTYGDPATPIPMSYLGEPTKTRLMHPGSEQLHVHHLHGGGDRWRANPNADDPNAMFGGLNKDPNDEALSIRLDSQTVGPDEAYDLEHECGAGGCQQSAGDFLFHCHIAMHYISGMWSFWRVFDTSQEGLAPLPGQSKPAPAVTSDRLIGQTFEGQTIIADGQQPGANEVTLSQWVERQLPPKGVRNNTDDATVWDWDRVGDVYLGEPETETVWHNYESPTPGERPEILFNPGNGRYAWPLFKPHLGMRPPFSANGHSGAPWLGEDVTEEREDGLCPTAPTRRSTFNVVAINTEINNTDNETDPEGRIFELAEEADAVTPENAEPLTIRSTVGDCVALTLTSRLNPDARGNNLDFGQKKVNMHTHFVQFDPQASDGVITGFSYEQSVNNYLLEGDDADNDGHGDGRPLTSGAPAGSTTVTTNNLGGLRAGIFLGIGVGTDNIEIRRITAINGNTITLDRALEKSHGTNEFVGVEFVQYRWFSDVDSGTVFFHDHVDGITSWARGLFAAHIIEPAGSSFHHPQTGAEIRSGTKADIHLQGNRRVGVEHAAGADFREFMIFLHNGRRGRPAVAPDSPFKVFNNGQECEEGTINLRAEPFSDRSPDSMERLEWNGGFCRNPGTDPDEENDANQGTPHSNETFNTVDPNVFSSVTYGDPATPLFSAYAGDPVVIRTVGTNERVEALRISGHRFRRERFNTSGDLMDAMTTGISERFDYVLDGGAGGPSHVPGDYLYYSTRNFALASGAWGIFRVHDTLQQGLRPLPDRAAPPGGEGFPVQSETGQAPRPPASADSQINPCPTDAPVRRYDVSIFDLPLPTGPNLVGENRDTSGVIYSLTQDRDRIVANPDSAEPLVLRANVGECVQVTLHNDIAADSAVGGTRASFNLAKLNQNVQQSGGGSVGFNPDTSVAQGQSFTYTFMADRNLGTSIFQNLASPASLIHGAYGLFITEPVASQWFDSESGERIDNSLSNGFVDRTASEAIIRSNFGTDNFREFTVTMGTTDQHVGRSVVPYWETVAGTGEPSQNSENPRAPFIPATDPIGQSRIQPGFNNVNYHTASALTRVAADGSNHGEAFLNNETHGDPGTPIFRAFAGDRTVMRVGIAVSNQFHTFSVGGHVFPWEANMWDDRGDFRSQLLTSRAMTSGETQDVELVGGAGTRLQAAGDYMYGDARDPFTRAGLWGILRVLPQGASSGPAQL